MRINYVNKPLNNGYIHHWLASGPLITRIDLDKYPSEQFRQLVFKDVDKVDFEFVKNPVERGQITDGLFQYGENVGSWDYYLSPEDHFLDHSGIYPYCAHLCSWGATHLISEIDQDVTFRVTTAGPFDLWLTDQLVYTTDNITDEGIRGQIIPVHLEKGVNKLWVRFENVGMGSCFHALALQICQVGSQEPAAKIFTRIPTLIRSIKRRNTLEKVFQTLFLDKDVYEWDERIRLHWPGDQREKNAYASVRLVNQAGKIYAEAEVDGTPGDTLTLGAASQFPEGAYMVRIMPRLWEYYEKGLRVEYEIPFWNIGWNKYSEIHYGTVDLRKQEALEYAIRQEGMDVFVELARMLSGKWEGLNHQTIQSSVDRVSQRERNSVVELLGLLSLVYRFGEHEQFPPTILPALEEAILNYQYHPDDQGQDVMDFHSEAGSLLFAVCQTMAGQRYPEKIFSRSGLIGSQLRERGEAEVLNWLHLRSTWGFTDWGSDQSYSEIIAGLSHLMELAENEAVWGLAGVMLDKMMFTIAINSFHGVYGGAQCNSDSVALKGGKISALAGITRLMWGHGVFTPKLVGMVSLLCNDSYKLPYVIERIATEDVEAMWAQEHQGLGEDPASLYQVSYRTPDYLLASAQEFEGIELGRAHVWQATLAPGAVVFTNHPGSSSESNALQANYWVGNETTPRVFQWTDSLIVLYNLAGEARLAFTHAYFPQGEFDETILRDGWAFARKGHGYLAIKATCGIQLTQEGKYAFRELRSDGRQNAWFCQMGRAAIDGDFTSFQEKVLGLETGFTGQKAKFFTLRGDILEVGWDEPCLLNGEIQKTEGKYHYHNDYTATENPCSTIELQFREDILRLDFG